MANEKRLIDANAFLESIEGTDWYTIRVDGSATQGAPSEEVAWYKATDIYAAVENAPTVDAVEVVHGHWKEYSHSALVRWKDGEPIWADRSVFRCSRCDFGTIARHNYCPRCGAKMDGGNEE